MAKGSEPAIAAGASALVLIDNRLYQRLESEIKLYVQLAGDRRKFAILLDSNKNLDDFSFLQIRDLIKSYRSTNPGLEGVLFIGNIKLPSFYKVRADNLQIRLFSAFYEDLDMNVTRHYGAGATDPYCDGTNSPYCQVLKTNGYVVPEHDFDDILTYPAEPDVWACYMPVGRDSSVSYQEYANQLRPYFNKLFDYYQGAYNPDERMYMVSNDLLGFNFWQLYDDVSKVDFYAMNPSKDTTCTCSGRTAQECYVQVPLEDYSSYNEFKTDYESRFWMGEGWQIPEIFKPHMIQNNYEFVVVNVHSYEKASIITSTDAWSLENGGMCMLASGCSVAGFKQPGSSSLVESVFPLENILVNYLYGSSNFLAALGAPSNRGHSAKFDKMINYMKNEHDYLGKAHLKRMRLLYNSAGDRIQLKEQVNEMLLGDPFLDVTIIATAQNSPYPLHLPFQAGTTWQVGGSGNFYGEGEHTNSNNEYYATDWNRVGGDDLGQPVFPVAYGKVTKTGFDANYGNYVDIVHSLVDYPPYGTIKTRSAHLNSIKVGMGDIVYLNTQIGAVGKTGNATDAHLHLSFQIFNGSKYVSMNGMVPSSPPSPMVACSGSQNVLWDLKDGEAKTAASKQFFNDVPNGFWAKSWIDAAYAWGVMEPYPKGQQSCFSPDVPVDRAYAAYYWVKAHHGPGYAPPPATGAIFNDVPASHWAAAYIEQAYRDGFVTGTSTNPPLYSPDRILKRAEMAVFILRALHGTTYYPPAPTGIFEDCPLDYWGSKWAEQLYREGITSGCCSSPLQFCPENPVTRAEIAVFLLRSFHIYPKSLGGIGIPASPEVPTTWQGNLVVKDAGNANAALAFGQAPSASDGLDGAFREMELPPVPPTGTFDARFELPVIPYMSSLIDYRNDQPTTTIWKIKFQPGSSGYPMIFEWNRAELPAGDFILKDAVTGGIATANMKSVDSLVISLSAINQMLIEKASLLSRTVGVNPGWNMISVPVAAQDMHYKKLFPEAASLAYGYANGYVTTDLLKNGFGYWLKFNDARNYNISGLRASSREIAVQAGWNMIGILEADVPIANIATIPSGIVQSNYYGFENGYQSTTTLRMGKGYWTKVSQSGKLVLPAANTLTKGKVALMTKDNLISDIDSWTQLELAASNGQSSIIYLAPNELSELFELPPVPPAGVFDVRFSSGRYAESWNRPHLEVLISSAQYPIRLTARNLANCALNLKDGQGGKLFDQTLGEGQEAWLEKNIGRLILTKAASAVSSLPKRYELSQNYPNPFNPTSVIKYALPEAGQVRISVYNLLGKKVADLVDEVQPAGYHQIEIDARNYASGIYYYVMKAKGFSAIKKMAIVK